MRVFLWCTLVLLVMSYMVPFASAQNGSEMEWGVEEGDKIYYDVIDKRIYLGETTTITERIYIEVLMLPEIPSNFDAPVYIPSAQVVMCYENGTQYDASGSFFIDIPILPIGNFTIYRELLVGSGTTGPDEYVVHWIEDTWIWGISTGYASVAAIINQTLHVSKADGALNYLKYSIVDIASGEEIQLYQVTRASDIYILVLTGSAAMIIICVVIIFERKRRS